MNRFSRLKTWVIAIAGLTGGLLSLPGQTANSDFYLAPEGLTFSITAPGILTNDTGGGTLTAQLVTGPEHGTLSLNTNGSFVYTPSNNFAGVDGFTYQAKYASRVSAPASVSIMVLAPGEIFHDTFSRPTNNSPGLPWKVKTDGAMIKGSWTITNGLMYGSGSSFTYGNTYYTNGNWTNYSVEAQIRFSAIYAASAGLVGRLNPATGARYSLWVYPEQSNEYNIPPLNGIPRLWLIKYSNWTNYTLIGQWSSLTSVGTNWHTVKLVLQTNKVMAYFDGNLVTNVTDNGNLDGQPPYDHGAFGLNMWESSPPPYTFSVDNFIVRTLAPTNPPVITNINLTNNTVTITWLSSAGATYRLQYNDTLTDTNWQDVAPDVTATGGTASQTNMPGGATRRFYRVSLIGS